MLPKKLIFLFCLLTLSFLSYAQVEKESVTKKLEFGVELELYPVGFIPTITSNVFIKENIALRFRIGGNFANRKDFSGLNDYEIARGFGASVGIRKYFPYRNGDLIVGITVDGWNMWTKWKDDVETSNPRSGTTYNFVFQPMINAGYLFKISEKWNTGLTLGFGREVNLIESGDPVGEGWIGALTLTSNFSLRR